MTVTDGDGKSVNRLPLMFRSASRCTSAVSSVTPCTVVAVTSSTEGRTVYPGKLGGIHAGSMATGVLGRHMQGITPTPPMHIITVYPHWEAHSPKGMGAERPRCAWQPRENRRRKASLCLSTKGEQRGKEASLCLPTMGEQERTGLVMPHNHGRTGIERASLCTSTMGSGHSTRLVVPL